MKSYISLKYETKCKTRTDTGAQKLYSTEFFFNFEVRHPRCVGSITKNFCVLHNEVEHNYISSSITLGLQLHVSALYVGHLQVVT